VFCAGAAELRALGLRHLRPGRQGDDRPQAGVDPDNRPTGVHLHLVGGFVELRQQRVDRPLARLRGKLELAPGAPSRSCLELDRLEDGRDYAASAATVDQRSV